MKALISPALLPALGLAKGIGFFAALVTLFISINNHSAMLINTMQAVTKTYVDKAGTCVSLAMSLASLFAIIHVLKLSYDIMSPGGSRFELKSLLRPVVIVFAISAYPTIVGGVNSLCNRYIQAETGRNVYLMGEAKRADLILNQAIQRELDVRDATINKNKEAAEKALNQAKPEQQAADRQAINGLTQEGVNRDLTLNNITNLLINNVNNLSQAPQVPQAHVPTDNEIKQNAEAAVQKDKKHTERKERKFWQLLHSVVTFVYTIFMVFVEFQLSIMTVLGVFALAFSLLDIWKQAFITFLGKYIELFMWKVVAGMVYWISQTVEHFAIQSEIGANANGKIGLTLMIVLVVASIIAILNVPKIASSILNIATPQDFGYGTAATAPAKGMKGAAGDVSKAISSKK